MRRGDIRIAVLAALLDGPGHGYEVMQRLEQRSGGVWRPSPGSVYPTLQLLEDEGFAQSTEVDGKRVYALTDAGGREARERIDTAGGAPFDGGDPRTRGGAMREAAQLMVATRQVVRAGTEDQGKRAEAILRDARKQLYSMLAED